MDTFEGNLNFFIIYFLKTKNLFEKRNFFSFDRVKNTISLGSLKFKNIFEEIEKKKMSQTSNSEQVTENLQDLKNNVSANAQKIIHEILPEKVVYLTNLLSVRIFFSFF